MTATAESTDIVTSVLVAVPATIAALAAWRAARGTKKQTTPSNGMLLSKMIEETRGDVLQVKEDLSYHVTVQHGRGPIPQ